MKAIIVKFILIITLSTMFLFIFSKYGYASDWPGLNIATIAGHHRFDMADDKVTIKWTANTGVPEVPMKVDTPTVRMLVRVEFTERPKGGGIWDPRARPWGTFDVHVKVSRENGVGFGSSLETIADFERRYTTGEKQSDEGKPFVYDIPITIEVTQVVQKFRVELTGHVWDKDRNPGIIYREREPKDFYAALPVDYQTQLSFWYMPITILYEPPGDLSKQEWTLTNEIGTAFYLKESSLSSYDISTSTRVTGLIGGIVPYSAEISAGLSFSAESSGLEGFIIRNKSGTIETTHEHLGPGRGDEFILAVNPVFDIYLQKDIKALVWVPNFKNVSSWGRMTVSAQELRERKGLLPGTPNEVYDSLHELDPLSFYFLRQPRFNQITGEYEFEAQRNLDLNRVELIENLIWRNDDGPHQYFNENQKISFQGTAYKTDFKAYLKADAQVGIPGIVGTQFKANAKWGFSTESNELSWDSSTIRSDALVDNSGNEEELIYTRVYVDKLYSTFLFKDVTPSKDIPIVIGTIQAPITQSGGTTVYLNAKGIRLEITSKNVKDPIKYTTTTNQKGEFAFPNILGDYTIRILDDSLGAKPLNVSLKEIKNIQLEPILLQKIPPEALNINIKVSPISLLADGKSTANVTVTVKDNGGKGISGLTITLKVTKGKGTIGTAKDNKDGTYSATYTASSQVGTETISASVLELTKSVDIKLTKDAGIAQYDFNNNGFIEKDEAITALNDYLLSGKILKTLVIEIINSYLLKTPVPKLN